MKKIVLILALLLGVQIVKAETLPAITIECKYVNVSPNDTAGSTLSPRHRGAFIAAHGPLSGGQPAVAVPDSSPPAWRSVVPWRPGCAGEPFLVPAVGRCAALRAVRRLRWDHWAGGSSQSGGRLPQR